jgi:hypothetical protein
MVINVDKIVEVILSVLFLPWLSSFVTFAWGDSDPFWLMSLKRAFLILPVMAIIFGYWTTIVNLASVPIRSKRREFLTLIFITWWDLGRAIAAFWAGIFKFLMVAALTVFSFVRLLFLGLVSMVYELLVIPFKVVIGAGNSMFNTGVPWVAVALTGFWCLLEAVIFTFVTTPLVRDTLGNMTGKVLSEGFIRVPLFIFMLFIILGSYAVLSNWTKALEQKDAPTIVKIGVIELVAMFVEVMFLYREFVDALIPWFAQYSSGEFVIGLWGTLTIAIVTWFGIRSLTWFLFAAHGTPLIMAVIQGTEIKSQKPKSISNNQNTVLFGYLSKLIDQLKKEDMWIKNMGERFVEAFVLPPLQIVAGAINFATLFIITQHLFELPIKSLKEVSDARTLTNRMSQKDSKRKAS